MSLLTQRGAGFEPISVEQLTGTDDQGKPTYGSPIDVLARVVREDVVVKLANGSEVRSSITLWIDAAQDPLPDDQDHIVLGDGFTGVVVEVKQLSRLDGTLDHVRVRLREE